MTPEQKARAYAALKAKGVEPPKKKRRKKADAEGAVADKPVAKAEAPSKGEG